MRIDADQQKIIDHKQGHALVLAGPGSGKTATIVQRGAHLIAEGIQHPQQIVMMTFTNKAAREMKKRLYDLLNELGLNQELPTITTFHSFGHRLISKNPESCGRTGQPSLMAQYDQEKMLSETLKKHLEIKTAKECQIAYEGIRNSGFMAGFDKDEKEVKLLLEETLSDYRVKAWEALCDYETMKVKLNLLDYHDLLTLPIRSLESDYIFRDRVCRYVNDLTIDEAQDTNLAQYRLIKLLVPAADNRSVLMIGDEDQAIHEWRGANPENLRMFKDEYQPTLYRLENNYRSLPEIVENASKLIQKNFGRFEKTGRATRPRGQYPMNLDIHPTGNVMAKSIAKQIQQTLGQGISPDQIAILYRTNRMAELLEPELVGCGIPYRVYKGTELMERSEIKMMIAALRLAANPRDWQAFERIAEMIPGLGKKRIADGIESMGVNDTVFDVIFDNFPRKIIENALPELEAIIELNASGPIAILNWITRPSVKNWIIENCREALKVRDIKEPEGFNLWRKHTKQQILSKTEEERFQYIDINKCVLFEEQMTMRVQTCVNRIKMVFQSISERIEALPANTSIDDLWQEALSLIIAPPDEQGSTPKVSLMTCHSAKGLEFQYVHVAGFSDGLMPLRNNKGEVNDISEERRLAFVAITRAKNFIYLHHANKINLMNGQGEINMCPSRFVNESGLDYHISRK